MTKLKMDEVAPLTFPVLREVENENAMVIHVNSDTVTQCDLGLPLPPPLPFDDTISEIAHTDNSASLTHLVLQDEIQTLEDSEPLNLISTNMADNMTRLVNSIMEDTDLDSLNHHSDSDQSDGIDPNSDQLPILPSISEISEEFLSGSSNIGLFGHLMIHVIDENGHPVMLPTDSLETGDLGPSLQLQSMPNVNIDEPSVAPEYLSINPPFRTFEIDPSLIEGSNRQILDQEFFIEHKLEVLHSLVPIEDRQPRRSYVLVKEDTKEDPYMCDLCGASFERARQYYGHLHQHTGERKWECSFCFNKVFRNHSLLRSHEKQFHLNLRPYCCKMCGARFDRLSQLSYHERRVHNNERPHVCQICFKPFFKRSDLKAHLTIHLGINKCICETCGRKFNHVSNLIRHTRMHSGVKPYPCSVCGRRFTQLSALHQHKTSHQIKRSIPCIFCRKMFKSFSDMRKHVRKMHKANLESIPENQAKGVLKLKETPQRRSYYCKVCGDTFKFSALLKKHEAQHDNETALQCKDCDQAYDSVEYFKSHSCQFKGNMSYSEIPKTTFMPTEEEQAALNLQLQNLLDEHNSLMDDPTRGLTSEIVIYVTREGQDEPTQCAKRKLAFDNPSTDSDDTNKNKPYRRPLQLNVHAVVSDSGLSSLSNQQNYRQNNIFIRTHYVDQQKFICSVCGISFAWKSTMNKHMTTIHSDYPLPKLSCETCGKQYSTATQVQWSELLNIDSEVQGSITASKIYLGSSGSEIEFDSAS
uniref:C2H2-type domain-containing protein n=1 Tax=Timema monikensis TaxID=170555 RepID=A0A7R9E3E4_9NEOP|nr:unnamed protein product [Timema monikensis]